MNKPSKFFIILIVVVLLLIFYIFKLSNKLSLISSTISEDMNGTYLYGNPIVDNNTTYLVIEDDYIFFYEEFKPIQKFEINYRDNNIIKINSKKTSVDFSKSSFRRK